MSAKPRVPEASVYRLSLYHCYLGELHRTEGPQRITSARLAQELNVKEETVRRDMSFIGGVGRPGSGYDSTALLAALQEFLGLKEQYPIIMVGTAQMIDALSVVFPEDAYGMLSVGYYSELADDVGTVVNGIPIRHTDEIPQLDPALGATVALVACTPAVVQHVIELLHEADITGVLLLTPAVKLERPEGMTVTHVRIPCDLKSIACRCQLPRSAEA